MSEPTLETISDYDKLSGQKRKVVWLVILAGLVVGALYVASYTYFGASSDALPIEKKIGTIPVQ